MKKVISVSLMLLFGLSVSAFARTTYNPDNTINVSSTIRGQKKLREQRISERRKFEQAAAAAAKINYVEFDSDDSEVVEMPTKQNIKK